MSKIDIYLEQKDKSRRLYLKALDEGNRELAREHALDIYLFRKMIEAEANKDGMGFVITGLTIVAVISFIGAFFI
ncbi:hypothetical protein ACF3NG_06950 [Aerococcaceae bacterium WGS1372]